MEMKLDGFFLGLGKGLELRLYLRRDLKHGKQAVLRAPWTET